MVRNTSLAREDAISQHKEPVGTRSSMHGLSTWGAGEIGKRDKERGERGSLILSFSAWPELLQSQVEPMHLLSAAE